MRHLTQVLGLVLLIAVVGPAVAIGNEAVLEERSIGADDALVTMIEYSSLTCPHCAEFHANILPKIKEQYIAPGKVRLVYRDFPLDPLATAAAMLPHCVEPDRYFGLLEGLFRSQSSWARSQEPAKELEQLSRFAGLSPAAFQSCINNKELLQAIQQRAAAARKEYDITSTPTFIIDGKKIVGATTFEEFQKVIDQHLDARRGETGPASPSGTASRELSESMEVGWMERQWERLRSWWDG